MTTTSPSTKTTWSSLTDADKADIVGAIRGGKSFAALARRYGIPRSTLVGNVRGLITRADAPPAVVVVVDSPRAIAERIRRAATAKRVDKILRRAKLPPVSRLPRSDPYVWRPVNVIGRRPPPRPIPIQRDAVTDVVVLPTTPRDLPRDDRCIMDVARSDWGTSEGDL